MGGFDVGGLAKGRELVAEACGSAAVGDGVDDSREEARGYAARLSPVAVGVLRDIMMDEGRSGRERISAAVAILDRGGVPVVPGSSVIVSQTNVIGNVLVEINRRRGLGGG